MRLQSSIIIHTKWSSSGYFPQSKVDLDDNAVWLGYHSHKQIFYDLIKILLIGVSLIKSFPDDTNDQCNPRLSSTLNDLLSSIKSWFGWQCTKWSSWIVSSIKSWHRWQCTCSLIRLSYTQKRHHMIFLKTLKDFLNQKLTQMTEQFNKGYHPHKIVLKSFWYGVFSIKSWHWWHCITLSAVLAFKIRLSLTLKSILWSH